MFTLRIYAEFAISYEHHALITFGELMLNFDSFSIFGLNVTEYTFFACIFLFFLEIIQIEKLLGLFAVIELRIFGEYFSLE